MLRNVGARPGDRLLLTKPLGSGIVTTAIKKGIAPAALVERAIAVMAGLNRAAGEALATSGAVHALTDVTGFGLLGHLWEMAEGSGVAVRVEAARVPLLDPAVRELAAQGIVPGGSKANLAWVRPHLRVDAGVVDPLPQVLADAQTNGGLLAAIAPERVADVLARLDDADVHAVEIGAVLEGPARMELV